jgi:hypothetical protein
MGKQYNQRIYILKKDLSFLNSFEFANHILEVFKVVPTRQEEFISLMITEFKSKVMNITNHEIKRLELKIDKDSENKFRVYLFDDEKDFILSQEFTDFIFKHYKVIPRTQEELFRYLVEIYKRECITK